MELLRPLDDAEFVSRTVAYTGTAGDTGTWIAGPQGIVIWSTTACYVVVGEGVTATTSNGTPIPSHTPIPFAVPQGSGDVWRVSAIQIDSGGSIYCKPMNIR
ncbi:hypothetical protein LCGC14_0886540 [marine sediment metagenome]|uniref:Uncharacterized protein n=1 Tax=marine sediment metagenome TaxID=412755 RepID=A0A0F9PL28_9ZZZZ